MKKLLLALVALLIMASVLLTGCSGGVSQDEYDRVAAELADIQSKYQSLQSEKGSLESALDEANNEKEALTDEIETLKEQYELVGATTAETVANIARYYHDTHEYSTTDLFVCSDMASEVWNMLKAQGINAVVVVGSINRNLASIIDSDHAWVMAEVEPGQYLAVETTAGVVKTKSDNPNYYSGWSYANPAMIKDYQFWVKEYNTRVAIHNEIVAYDNEVIQLYNASTNQAQADKYEAVHNKLTEIIQAMQADMTALMAQINSLATVLNI